MFVKVRQALSVLFPISHRGASSKYDGQPMKNEPDKGNLRMNINNNRNNAHHEIDRVFKILLPTRNMPERPTQVALSHQMLDAMLEGVTQGDAGSGD